MSRTTTAKHTATLRRKVLLTVLSLVLVFTLIPVISMTFSPEVKAYETYSKNYSKEWHYDQGTVFLKDFALGWGNATGAGSPYSAGTVRGDLERIGTRIDKDFNDGAGGYYVYIAYRTTTNPAEAVTGVMIEDANNRAAKSYGGSTWYAANSGDHDWVPYLYGSSNGEGAVDLNKDAGGDYLFLYVTKDPNYGAPILGSVAQQTGKGKTSKSGYTVVRSFQDPNNAIDLNKDAGGDYIYLFYQNPTATQVNSDALRWAYQMAKATYDNGGSGISGLSTALDTASVILEDLNDGYTTKTQTEIDNAKTALLNSLPTMSLSTSYTLTVNTAGEGYCMKYTPSANGTYIFWAQGSEGDPLGYIYDGNGTEFAKQDDVGNSSNGNPAMQALMDLAYNRHYVTYTMTAGTTYYLYTKNYSSSATNSYTYMLSKPVTLTFDSTGGGANDVKTNVPSGGTLALSKASVARDGHELIAWSTMQNGREAKSCMASDSITVPSSDTTYYALWYPTNAPELVPNTGYTATIGANGKIAFYQFTPSVTKTYLCYGLSSVDTYGMYDEADAYHTSANFAYFSDDQGDTSFGQQTNQFRFEKELEAGKTYLFAVKNYYYTATDNVPFRFEEVYTVSYDANGGEGAPTDVQKKYYNRDITLSTTEPTKTPGKFLGWSTDPGATAPEYLPGASYSANADAVLYAVWEKAHRHLQGLGRHGTEDRDRRLRRRRHPARRSLQSRGRYLSL